MTVLPDADTILPPSASLTGQRMVIRADATLVGTTSEPAIDADILQFARPYLGKDLAEREWAAPP